MVKIDSTKNVPLNSGTQGTSKTANANKSASIMGDKIIKDEMGTSLEKSSGSDVTAMCDLNGILANNEDILKKIGCPVLRNVAGTANSKGKAVSDGVVSALKGFGKEMDAILGDSKLSEEDKEKKITQIKQKQAAVIAEGEAKMGALVKLSNCLMDILPMFLKLQGTGTDLGEFTSMLTELIMGVSSSPSDFSKVKDEKDLQKKLKTSMKNIFGKNSMQKMEKFVEVADKKIEEADRKAAKPDIDPQEKVKAQEESKLYAVQKKVFEEFFKQFDEIKIDED